MIAVKQGERVKCRWKDCPCENLWMPREEAVRDGTLYFHKDCYKNRENTKIIEKLWKKYIWPDVNPRYLHEKIVSGIHNYKLDSDFILFGTEYLIKTKSRLQDPIVIEMLGTYSNIKDEWEKHKENIIESGDSGDGNSTD